MTGRRLALLVAAKDLRVEARSKRAVVTTLFFSFLILVIFKFSFDPGDPASRAAAPGILWVALLFPGVLQLNRSFDVERADDTLSGLLLSPLEPERLFIGKWLANWTYLVVVDLFVLVAFMVLFNIAFEAAIAWLLLLIPLAAVPFTAVGTLFAAMVSSLRSREAMLPILLFPLLIPSLIASVSATREVLGEGAQFLGSWIQLLCVTGVVFGAASYILFGYVLGEE